MQSLGSDFTLYPQVRYINVFQFSDTLSVQNVFNGLCVSGACVPPECGSVSLLHLTTFESLCSQPNLSL